MYETKRWHTALMKLPMHGITIDVDT